MEHFFELIVSSIFKIFSYYLKRKIDTKTRINLDASFKAWQFTIDLTFLADFFPKKFMLLN
jgi:hypothetical protein